MAIDSISAAYNKKAEEASMAIGTYNKSTLDSTDFLKLLAAQLQYQDPSSPMSNSEMMQSLTQMGSMQATSSMVTAIENMNAAMANMNQVSLTGYATGMMGKTVTVAVENSKGEIEKVEGVVTGVSFYEGIPLVSINGKSYSLSQVMSIGEVPKEDTDSGSSDKTEDTDSGSSDKTEDTEVKPEA